MVREQRIEELVGGILAGDESLIYELWGELDNLCGWYCRKLIKQLPKTLKLEFEDLYHCGFIALRNALQHCSPENHAGFTTFYLLHLTGTINEENHLRQGGRDHGGLRRYDPVIAAGTVSLDAPIDESQDNPDTMYNRLGDVMAMASPVDAIERILDEVYNQQLHDILEDLIDALPVQQQLVIRLKYYENQDCAAIAEVMNIKRGRVYSLEDQALIQLRRTGIAAGLGQFLSDDVSYYTGTGVRQFTTTGSSSTERLALKHIAMENRFVALEASCIE